MLISAYQNKQFYFFTMIVINTKTLLFNACIGFDTLYISKLESKMKKDIQIKLQAIISSTFIGKKVFFRTEAAPLFLRELPW